MLVLSRKENETIVIDDSIRVTIVRCGRGKVKLGIQAPDHISIVRAELDERDERLPESTREQPFQESRVLEFGGILAGV